MSVASSGSRLLVPIANPETVDRLLDTAIDIARVRSMAVVAVHVVDVPAQVPLSEGERVIDDETQELLAYVDDRTADETVDVETKIRYARDTATGLVGSVEAYDGEAMLLGWRGRPRRRDIILGSFLDHVLAAASCDVYVKRITGPSPAIDSVLVPIAGGPHDALAAALAGTLATQHEAEILLFHVTDPDTESDETDSLFSDRRGRIPADVTVEQQCVTNQDVGQTLTDASTDHDLTILGATRDTFLNRRLVGSVAQTVGRSAHSSVIVTRSYVTDAADSSSVATGTIETETS